METLRRGSRGEDVARLQRLLTLVGEFDGSIDGIFGDITEASVRDFQSRNGLVDDGKVGVRTADLIDELMLDGEVPLELLRHAWRERDAANLDLEPPADAPVPEAGSDSGDPGDPGEPEPHDADRASTVLARAESEWNGPVHEPPGTGWERIDEYIRGPLGLHWTWETAYTTNLQFAWCGAFAAFCLEAAGLSPEVRQKAMPSTYRLYNWAKDTPRLLLPEEAAAGDIVIVGPEKGKRWGAHVTLCEFVDDDGQVATFEGNAHGTGPDGANYEGVIRRRRPMPQAGLAEATYRVIHVIRPLDEDFVT